MKKLLEAATAEAADSEVCASVPMDVFKAVCRLPAVAVEFAPMVNSFGPGVAEVVAVSVRLSLVPSGRLKDNVTVSPGLGLVAPKSIEADAGGPAATVTAPAIDEVAPASLKPNGDPATSSATLTPVVDGSAVIASRPRPSAPRSAALRCAITVLRPSWVASPLRMVSIGATEG